MVVGALRQAANDTYSELVIINLEEQLSFEGRKHLKSVWGDKACAIVSTSAHNYACS